MEWKDDMPTPDEIIRAGRKSWSDLNKFLPWFMAGALLLVGAGGVVYSIGPDEMGVIQRFGKYTDLTTPGLHVKLPYGIDKVTPVKVEKILKEEFGVRTSSSGSGMGAFQQQNLEESLMLTGDLNILDVRWIVQFKIKDPVKLLFAVRNPRDAVRDVAEVVMRRLAGDYTVDEVLTVKREEIDMLAQIEMQTILDEYQVGVQIVTVKLLDVNPPEKVKPAFNEVNEAKQEKEKMINQAWEAYNKVVPRAKGEAEKTIREAEGYSLDKINRAKGEAERFLATLGEYKNAPDITKKRLYLETMSDVLPRVKDKYIIDPSQTSILPLLNLGDKRGIKQ
ncbi:MAG: FtsH protease activity modulator HflK [Candidatus Omnitrophota bacterium]